MTRRKFQGAKRIDSSSEYHDQGLEDLVKKLRAWLLQQPSFIAVLSADRNTRKRYAARIADECTKVPPLLQVKREVVDD